MDKIWKAKWIMDEDFQDLKPINVFHKQLDEITLPEHPIGLRNRHMLVRKTFKYDRDFKNAYIDITADDYYKLYINGVFVGQGPAPSYHFHYNYNRYDISDYLNNGGENVIAVHVYYQGLINRVWNSGDLRQGMIAEIFIDGKLCTYTDSSWKYAQAREYTGIETVGYETQYLENIDNRLKEIRWKEFGFDDSIWKSAVVKNDDDYELIQQLTPALEVYEIPPNKVEQIKPGHYLIDFGHEITGQFIMEAKGSAGQKIEILCAEELEEKDGYHVRFDMRCNCKYQETWILSGAEDVLDLYDYKAFRYVEVIAPEGVIKDSSFCAFVRHYPLDEDNCRFLTSNLLLNNIWNICKNGVKYGSQEVYVDCPSREKGQYLGDATVTSHSQLILSGDLRLFKKMLQDFALSTHVCKGIMAVAPGSFMQEIADFSLQWPLQLYNYYMHSGDLDFLKEMLPIAEGIIQYFKKYQREDGLLENVKEKWNLVDWPQNLRDDYDFDLSVVVGDGCHNVINAFYCGAVKVVNDIKGILGLDFEDEFPKLKEAFQKAFYRKELKLFVDSTVSSHASLHSNIIALFYGLTQEEAKKTTVELIKQKGMNCGVYNTYFLLKGLAGIEEYELVYKLITSEDEHSWGNMLKEGATTCFEAWGKEQKWNTSLCHPWASAPIPVLTEDIIGLKPSKPGWEEIVFCPHIPKGLDIELEIETIKGRIKVNCRNEKVHIEVPDGVKLKSSI